MWNFIKKVFKYGIGLIILLGVIGAVVGKNDGGNNYSTSSSSSTKQTQEAPKNYAEADINILISDLENNAAKANKDYKGKYVKIVNGSVSNIDSDADYVSLKGGNPYTLSNVQCFAKSQKVKDAIINLSRGQAVTIYGKVNDVGEILGYSVDIDKIE